ncbi:hypothetical protein [Bradyrhizobium valentinum]|uniref:hypothetical protein n=1 Tax=Bradyrhizobium valentinum TaxID=1518501 RepID=UPI000A5A513C|nr:hypothetical protein [Bradyrhizobium valentinum]
MQAARLSGTTIDAIAEFVLGCANLGQQRDRIERAILIAYAMYLLRTQGARDVRIHPDGEHGKQFDFTSWLGRQAFTKVSSLGSTAYGGVYRNPADQTITINPKSGLGDVVAAVGDHVIAAECKGGIINTRHPGQVSRLYRGLCETVGMLMATPSQGRQVAVVPLTEGTLRLAERLAPRCALAGIEIALVGSRGEVLEVKAREAAEQAAGRNDA